MTSDIVRRIGQFEPVPHLGRERSERHYREVHTRFARRMFREKSPLLRLYATNVAMAQYDIAGTFHQSPSAWRFVMSEVAASLLEAGGDSDAAGWLPEENQNLTWRDHLNCLCNIRAYEVTQTVLHSNPRARPSSTKFVALIESTGDEARGEEIYQDTHLPGLEKELLDAFGLVFAASNVIERQLETAPVEYPGQMFTGGYVTASPRIAIEEFYFDNADWGYEFFAREPIYALYHRDAVLSTEVYEVEEDIGLARSDET